MSLGFRFIYTGIRVKNMEESLEFCTDVLGMIVAEPLQKTPPTNGSVITLKSPNSEQVLELNHYEEDIPFNLPYVNGSRPRSHSLRCSRPRSNYERIETTRCKSCRRAICDRLGDRMERSVHPRWKWNLDRTLTTELSALIES